MFPALKPATSRATRAAGSVLATVVAVLGVLGILAWGLMDLSLRASRTGAWSRDHLALRLLAESAVEEVFLKLSREANAPGTESFRALRAVARASDGQLELPAVDADLLRADLGAQKATLGAEPSLECAAEVRSLMPVSADPLERTGLLRVEATLRLGRRPLASVERFREDRAFRIARTSPGRPLDQVGFLVEFPKSGGLKNFPKGVAAYAVARDRPRTLLELLTTAPPDGLQASSPAYRAQLLGAFEALRPEALAARAHFVTHSAAELNAFLASRLGAGLPVNGIVHNLSPDPVQLAFPKFRGRCLLSLQGPVVVGDIRLDEPSKDQLTIVGAGRFVVNAGTVQAALVKAIGGKEGILFARRCQVTGALLSAVFPGSLGLSEQELGACRFEHDPRFDSGTSPGDRPAERLLAHYFAAFSPHPVSVEHGRDREGWSKW